MSMTKKLTALCTDMGAAQSVIPVIRALRGSYAITVLVDGAGKAADAFKKTDIQFTTIGKDTPLRLDCDVLLTGTTPPQYKEGKLVHYGREAEAWQSAGTQSREREHDGISGIVSMALLDKYNRSENRGRFTIQPGGTVLQFPDYVLAPNQYAVGEISKEFHAMPGRVTGNPAFDDIPERKQKAQRHYDGRIVPVFMSSQNFMKQNGMDNHELLEIASIAAYGKAHLVVKAHPKDQGEMGVYQATLSKYKSGELDTTHDSEELAFSLREDEFCIGTSGTLIETATLADVLALSIKPRWQGEDDVITNVMRVTPFACTREDGLTLMQRALDEQSFRREWKEKRSDYRTDGMATGRVVELIRRL